MTTTEILSAILTQFPGSALVRRSKQTFIAVPMGENEDGVMEYAKVAVGNLLSKDTANHTAFNFDAAVAEYEAYAAEQAEKTSKPKAEKKKSGPDPKKVAAMNARKEAALAWLISNPGEYPAKDIKDAMPDVYGDITIMQVGTDLKSLMNDGSVVYEVKEGKKYWRFNG